MDSVFSARIPSEKKGDLISRQQAIQRLCQMRCGCEPKECGLTFEEDGAEECADVRWLRSIPSAQPGWKKGKWIRTDQDKLLGKYRCSECGLKFYVYAKGNYCPNCGADMRGEEDETN